MEYELYFLRSSEQHITKEFLPYAVGLDEGDEGLEDYPELEQYERLFGTFNADLGVYAMVGHKIAGAAWVRLLANGAGFVDHDTPELMVALKPAFRQQGYGTRLLEQLLSEVANVFDQVSLWVPEGSSASQMFSGLGFEKIAHSEFVDFRGRKAFKMLKHFEKVKVDHPDNKTKEKALEDACYRKSLRPTHLDF